MPRILKQIPEEENSRVRSAIIPSKQQFRLRSVNSNASKSNKAKQNLSVSKVHVNSEFESIQRKVFINSKNLS